MQKRNTNAISTALVLLPIAFSCGAPQLDHTAIRRRVPFVGVFFPRLGAAFERPLFCLENRTLTLWSARWQATSPTLTDLDSVGDDREKRAQRF
jgi:hypothetical protein